MTSSTSESVLQAPVAVLLAAGEPEAAEQHLAQLLGRADVEAAAGQLPDLRFQRARRLANSADSRDRTVRSTSDAFALHVGQHGTSGRSSVS
jgi:hypothetical protein